MLPALRSFGGVMLTAVLMAIIFSATLASVYMVGPEIETRFFPVVDKLQINTVIPRDEPGHALVLASYNKLRACDYLSIVWLRRIEAGSTPMLEHVAIELSPVTDQNGANRPVGWIRAGPWDVSMSPEEIRGQSVVRLYHRCHPFWTTMTEWYP